MTVTVKCDPVTLTNPNSTKRRKSFLHSDNFLFRNDSELGLTLKKLLEEQDPALDRLGQRTSRQKTRRYPGKF